MTLTFIVKKRSGSKDILGHLYPKVQKQFHILRLFQRGFLATIMLGFAVLLVYAIQNAPAQYQAQTVQARTYILIDNSISMNTKDFDANSTSRLEGAKQKINELLEHTSGEITLVTFHSDQLIYDSSLPDASRQKISQIEAVPYFSTNGSSFGSLFYRLQQEIVAQKDQKTTTKSYMVFVSDGEETSEGTYNLQMALEGLKPFISGGIVLGSGTEAGGEVLYNPYSFSDLENTGKKSLPNSISQRSETNLETIASTLGLSKKELKVDTDMSYIAQEAQIPSTSPAASSTPSSWYWPVSIALLILITVYVWYPRIYLSAVLDKVPRKDFIDEKK